ncbi:Concanavalin A-like lectin/glucanases superfamily protein [Arachidicoccus rhizosphaerae]|uniref:Concanavalin A-like lectin/glucanases superfamily protein n=1 Tax=Arachidicoccus rhizosphaerae TaxID=551991 RepID=A0A1H3XAZ4_9BACT|nr:alkaline phosphatase family protein [Arachidicoccus rhizosphaerae]SDZ96519.1 Concanavalin A-like lectin/glucanases superfamily protein [Arachidicoccus rhizosphaerae]
MKTKYFNNRSLLIILSCFIFLASCKKYADPPPYFEEYGEDSVSTQRKVLIITIDGLSGEQLENANMTNLQKLIETGKYSYAQLKNVNSSDAAGWVTLLTGTGYGKHQIYDSSFLYVPSGDVSDGEDESIPFVPNVISYIQQTKPGYKTALVSPWQNLVKYAVEADYPYAVTNDAAVKDSAVSLLKVNTMGVMFVDFNGAELAGNAGKYDITDAGFKSAVDKIDGYVGDIVEALKARENYDAEDWLIMVTSPRGGSPEQSSQGFVIASNPKLKKEELKKVGFNTVDFTGSGNQAAIAYVPDDKGLYNFGADKDFTFQVQVSVPGNNSYPGFLGKTDGGTDNNFTGWFLMQEGDHYNVEFSGKANGGSGKNQISVPTSITGGNWHTITVSVKTENGVRTAYCYTDGVFVTSKDITGVKNINVDAPLKVGYCWGGAYPSFHAADFEIFNVALDAQTIAANISLKNIKDHPYYDNLIGFWPIDEGGGGLVTNQAPGGYDMMLMGNFVWEAMGSDVPVSMVPDASIGTSVVPVTEDIVANMFYWLKVEPESSWGLQGQDWLVKFEREIYGL